MKFHELNTSKQRGIKRVGRGIAAGQGKTAGRGTKGQKSRSGYSRKPGFEGGQNPLYMRFPKLRGFRSHRGKFDIVYTEQLASLGTKIDNHSLVDAGLVETPHSKVKLLSRGEYNKKQTIHLQAASKSAIDTVTKAGGTFQVAEQVGRIKQKSDTK